MGKLAFCNIGSYTCSASVYLFRHYIFFSFIFKIYIKLHNSQCEFLAQFINNALPHPSYFIVYRSIVLLFYSFNSHIVLLFYSFYCFPILLFTLLLFYSFTFKRTYSISLSLPPLQPSRQASRKPRRVGCTSRPHCRSRRRGCRR